MNALLSILDDYDHRLLMAVLVRRRRSIDLFMRAVTRLADPIPAIALGWAFALGPVLDLRPAGATALATLIVSHLMVQVAKRTATRTRPALEPFEALIQIPGCFSFPSGHAAAGLSIALPLAVAIGGALGAATLALGLVVGVSRCYLGVHYPGDVVAGWTLALLTFIILA
jgi:undecaprenyl-diphosphatase